VRAADDRWADRTQQDGQEFLAWFLQRLLGEMVPGCSAARALQGLLGGQLLGTTTCGAQGCGRCSHKQDPLFGSLQVELPEPAAAWTPASARRRPRRPLQRQRQQRRRRQRAGQHGGLVEPSQLRGENSVWCQRCGQRRDASRQLLVDECPPLLILALMSARMSSAAAPRVLLPGEPWFAWQQDALGGYTAHPGARTS
jgi:hypothetical protein